MFNKNEQWIDANHSTVSILNFRGQNFMNLSYVADLPAASSNLNHRFKVKDQGRIIESVIQIWTAGKQFKFIKFGPSSFKSPKARKRVFKFEIKKMQVKKLAIQDMVIGEKKYSFYLLEFFLLIFLFSFSALLFVC